MDNLPTVTQILNTINKPFLIKWSNKMGLKGVDINQLLIEAQNIGHIVHKFVESYFKGIPFDIKTLAQSETEIKQAENSITKIREWIQTEEPLPILIEERLYCYNLFFSGQPDLVYRDKNGLTVLADFKTGRYIHREYKIQTSAYKYLLEKAGYHIDVIKIIKAPKTDNDSLEIAIVEAPEFYFDIFKVCLNLYYMLDIVEDLSDEEYLFDLDI